MVMMMIMMMTMIIRESVVRARDVLEKLRSPKLWLFSKQSSLYCAASAMAASCVNCYVKDYTR